MVLVQVSTGTRYKLEILHQSVKRVKNKSQKFLEANSYICRSYRGRTGREAFLTSPPILNRVNADLSKQAQDFFRRKNKNISHTLLHFNNNIVLETPYQKHPGIFDASLTFEEHLKVITTKVNKIIRMLW